MGFNVTYSAGGVLDEIKKVLLATIDNVNTVNQILSGIIDTVHDVEQVDLVTLVQNVQRVEEISNILAGTLDTVKNIQTVDLVRNVQIPGVIPTLTKPFVKGFQLEVPAVADVYEITYEVTEPMELVSIYLACSGYHDRDYWDLLINSQAICETIYTKEIPEVIGVGVVSLNPSDVITIRFNNNSSSSKIIWANLKFFK